MIPMRLHEVAAWAQGTVAGIDEQGTQVSVTAFAVDHRDVAQGSVFVAIRGERVDGHDYAEQAVAAGAVAVLSARPLADARGAALPCIVVDDPVTALGRIAAVVRDRLDCRVVAITGSSGKTSTKDLVAAVLRELGPVVSPQGSFNTEVGLPLTVLSADESTAFLVLEMGMRGIGHIAYLVGIARPDAGVVVNVGSAHVGMLGSQQAIAQAKSELVSGLGPDAVAILNGDDPLVRAMSQIASGGVMLFGEGPDCDVRAVDVQLDDTARPSFDLSRDGARAHVDLGFHGEHYISNALAAAAVGLAMGADPEQVARALSAARPTSKWRMQVEESSNGVTVVNDAYNANPESMRAALKTLAAMAHGRRTWAVLGEMKELGDAALEEHDAIGRLAVRLDISRLVCVGPGTRVMHLAASNEGSWGEESIHVPDAQAAVDLLRAQVRPGDIVLVKASRSVGLEAVALALLEEGS
jgi:UDP-N-acetylmuramoyl-tripeptide--D-alanyl-D-alanine ligase